ncbi:MAG: Uma2 family endonuclease [Streptosporangiales bacterium]|nr:Uma2 family endonuclease [Streptosporangiales bacterium]
MSEAAAAVTARGPWTLDDLMGLPDDGQRYEIIDGSLLVSPAPGSPHQRAAHRLAATLNRDLGSEWEALEAVGILLRRRSPIRLIVPDVVVARVDTIESEATIFSPADVALAVEIVSQSSTTMDRVTKPNLLAEASVSAYWRVEPKARGGPVVHLYRLTGGRYREADTVKAGEVRQIDWPVSCRLVPAELTGPRRR